MSKLSKKATDEFKQIYAERRGVELTDAQASEIGWKLLELASITLEEQ